MSDYWDLTERQRALLDDLGPFEDYELMAAGLRRVGPAPDLRPVPAAPELPTFDVYVVRAGYTALGAFLTLEDAQACVRLRPRVLEENYGTARKWLAVERDVTIDIVQACDHDAKKRAEKDDKLRADVLAANERAEKDHRDALDKQESVLEEMRDDWAVQRAHERDAQRVAETWAEYRRLAGDDAVAHTFLLKAFTDSQVRFAEEWLECTITPSSTK